MGVLAFLVDIVLQRLNSFKYTAVKTVVSHHGGFWAPYMVWLVFTMGYAALSAFLVTSYAPLGAGSGIPEIKTYLNGVHIKGLHNSSEVFSKIGFPNILVLGCWTCMLPNIECFSACLAGSFLRVTHLLHVPNKVLYCVQAHISAHCAVLNQLHFGLL